MVSILKAHISNPNIYELSHQGFLKKDIMKKEALKEIEQMRRYIRMKESLPEEKESKIPYSAIKHKQQNKMKAAKATAKTSSPRRSRDKELA